MEKGCFDSTDNRRLFGQPFFFQAWAITTHSIKLIFSSFLLSSLKLQSAAFPQLLL
jgi:hypothetical protein